MKSELYFITVSWKESEVEFHHCRHRKIVGTQKEIHCRFCFMIPTDLEIGVKCSACISDILLRETFININNKVELWVIRTENRRSRTLSNADQKFGMYIYHAS